MKRALKFKSHNFFDYIFHHLFFLSFSRLLNIYVSLCYAAVAAQRKKRENADGKNKTFFQFVSLEGMLQDRERIIKNIFYFYDYVSLLLSHMNIVLEYEMNFSCLRLSSCNLVDIYVLYVYLLRVNFLMQFLDCASSFMMRG